MDHCILVPDLRVSGSYFHRQIGRTLVYPVRRLLSRKRACASASSPTTARPPGREACYRPPLLDAPSPASLLCLPFTPASSLVCCAALLLLQVCDSNELSPSPVLSPHFSPPAAVASPHPRNIPPCHRVGISRLVGESSKTPDLTSPRDDVWRRGSTCRRGRLPTLAGALRLLRLRHGRRIQPRGIHSPSAPCGLDASVSCPCCDLGDF
jgi:hypothetical protein